MTNVIVSDTKFNFVGSRRRRLVRGARPAELISRHLLTNVRVGPFSGVGLRSREVSFAPLKGHGRLDRLGRKCADSVAKVENRTTLEISQTLMFGRLRRCNAL
jgi:hypothetical protein